MVDIVKGKKLFIYAYREIVKVVEPQDSMLELPKLVYSLDHQEWLKYYHIKITGKVELTKRRDKPKDEIQF